jgi:hypothetical protein
MKTEQLVELLTKHAGAKKDGASLLVGDAQPSFYIALPGETLQVVRVTRVDLLDTYCRLDTQKGERFFVAIEDIRALKLEGETPEGRRERHAGFTR